jgi:hypothetical protein
VGAITKAEEEKLFSLQTDSDQKQIESVNRKYDSELKAAKNNAAIIQAVEQARTRDL